jgi:hypothetical protein
MEIKIKKKKKNKTSPIPHTNIKKIIIIKVKKIIIKKHENKIKNEA